MSISHLYSQNVSIPDQNFKDALIQQGVDLNADGEINYFEASTVTDLLLKNDITFLTGIEAFINLEELNCNGQIPLGSYGNTIKYLDVSNNLKLKSLRCDYNLIDTLLLGQNSELQELNCNFNEISKLDLSGCPNLRLLFCGGNPLDILDISNCKSLETLSLEEMEEQAVSVCVWTPDFPPEGMVIHDEGSPYLSYTDCYPPILRMLGDSLYRESFVQFTSSEEGMAYLIQANTEINLETIRSATIDSIEVSADYPTNFSLEGFENNIYSIVARDSADNISLPAIFGVHGVGVEIANGKDPHIFPNPVSGILNIHLTEPGSSMVSMMDMDGRKVYNNSFNSSIINLDLSYLSAGIYILKVRSEVNSLTQKIVVK